MAERTPASPVRDDEDRLFEGDPRVLTVGIVLTILVHAALAVVLAFLDEPLELPAMGAINRGLPLCDGHRCGALANKRPRLGIETALPGDIDIIQAAVIPRLGMLEQDPKKLPELQEYEQPEKAEDGVNLTQDNPPPASEEKLFKEHTPKPQQLDRRRKERPKLTDILAPEDDDPRTRKTRLDSIIGRPDGHYAGVGTEAVPGSEWAGRVIIVLRREFIVPASLDDATLKLQSVEIAIRQISAKGEILKYEVVRRSRSGPYDTAALQLVKKFVPEEGGTLTLPEPPADVRNYINTKGMTLVLEGRLFKR
jgi:hypothetical protein